METKTCQNCKQNFTIEPNDFGFYEKIKVSPPTFCPECRLQRRLAWRNERALYKRNCDLCKKSIIAMYHQSAPFPVYCNDCWYGDNWDPASYARDYNPSKTFFEQFKEFSNTVPRAALWQRNVINSDYSNMTGESKNVYLSVSVVKGCENVFYSKCVDNSKDIVDCLNIINGSESLYEVVEAQGNYNSQYLLLCRATLDSYYSVDLINCSNCFLSYNLRNKKFCIRNQEYSKEDYFKELEKFNLKSRASREKILKEFEEIKRQAIYKFGNITKCVDVTGNNLLNVKNSKSVFEIYDTEDSKYCYRAFGLKDCMDFTYGGNSELMYEYTTGAEKDYNVKFSCRANNSTRDAEYIESCQNCTNIFGCISLRNKDNSIFNKQYSKDEFTKLRLQIIKDMSSNPFFDKVGRKYEYGEFFPIEISPWAYNETPAQEYYPLTKEEALKSGYPWRDENARNFKITLTTEEIPDNIEKVRDNILNEVIECAHQESCNHQCTTAFRLTDYELKFYKKHQIPLPILCPNCRYYERIKVMPALKLWKRSCMCDKENHSHAGLPAGGCPNEFETAYAPERPEIIYCEKCYQQEVY